MEQYNTVSTFVQESDQASAHNSELQYLLTVVKQLESQLDRQARKISRLESSIESIRATL